jgi:uncharacterized protein (DUF1697 family)
MANKYISLLRGINVGGNRKILMADLKSLCIRLGFENVLTYIQSGNVVFETDTQDTVAIAAQIEAAIAAQFGFDVPVVVLSADSLRLITTQNPFLATDPNTPIEKLHVTFLSEIPTADNIEKANIAVRSLKTGSDAFCVIGNAVYIQCEKYHETKFSNAFFERQLSVKATTRNWKTVLQLDKMAVVD